MGRRTVDLVEYSPQWPAEFERERVALAGAFGDDALVIEHVGSTAVPGLIAKPTIDIAVVVGQIEHVHRHRDALEALGYEFRSGFHAGHVFLRKVAGDERTHHLHCVVDPSGEFHDWLLFRDLLRRSADARRRYAGEKVRLAALHYHDRGAYVAAKAGIVSKLLGEARAARRAAAPR